jgi:hypothetical protein
MMVKNYNKFNDFVAKLPSQYGRIGSSKLEKDNFIYILTAHEFESQDSFDNTYSAGKLLVFSLLDGKTKVAKIFLKHCEVRIFVFNLA